MRSDYREFPFSQCMTQMTYAMKYAWKLATNSVLVPAVTNSATVLLHFLTKSRSHTWSVWSKDSVFGLALLSCSLYVRDAPLDFQGGGG